MLRLEREPRIDTEPQTVQDRWSRTIGALGNQVWSQVHQSHILLIGLGRNGTLAAWQFAGLGVCRFTFVDPDILGIENLEGMPGMSIEDVGHLKATSLANRMIASNPDLAISCLAKPVTDALSQLRSRFDLIVTCVDNDTPRLAASWLSRERLVPHLDIGTSVQRNESGTLTLAGDIRLLMPYEGCVQCVGGIANTEETMYEFAGPAGSMFRGEPTKWNEHRAGSLVHLNSITVGAAMENWLSMLRGQVGSYWQRIDWNTRSASPLLEGAMVSAEARCIHCKT